MAGRYDPNPFDEEEVNPFIVSLCPFFYFYAKFVFFFKTSIKLNFVTCGVLLEVFMSVL
jgi:hypothetical protein